MRLAIAFTALSLLAGSAALSAANADTMKNCAANWKAMSAADKAKTTYKDYSSSCMKGTAKETAGSPAMAAPAQPLTPMAPAAKPAMAAPMTAKPAMAAAGGPGQVWVNTKSKVYHCSGTQYYGKTKEGSYMTETAAVAAGNRADHGKACSK
jgi:hypothetical protein